MDRRSPSCSTWRLWASVLLFGACAIGSLAYHGILFRFPLAALWVVSSAWIAHLMGLRYAGFWRFPSWGGIVFAYAFGMLAGTTFDYLAIVCWGLYEYPFQRVRWYLVYTIPLYWGLFTLMVIKFFTYFHVMLSEYLPNRAVRFPVSVWLTTSFLFLIVEGWNLPRYSWRYMGAFEDWRILYGGWFVMILVLLLPLPLLRLLESRRPASGGADPAGRERTSA